MILQLFLMRDVLLLLPWLCGIPPWPNPFPRRPHAHKSQLALPSASTPALLIHPLTLLRTPLNQIIPLLAVFSKHLNEWIVCTSPQLLGRENKHCSGSAFYGWQCIWGVVSTSLCTLACTHAAGEDKRSSTELISTWQAF